ncbi:MAG: PEGA domain-containing protein [Deltaproteobacteria bacterium]|nr:PEGA domain-containing protein [Deltaproteobacteria bacterium]
MKTQSGILVAVCVAVLTTGVVAPARAQTDSASASDAQREEARELFRRGRELYQRGRSEEALEILTQAWNLYPSWAVSNGMALCVEKLGRMDEALTIYERSLVEGGDSIPADQRSQIEERVRELRRELRLARLSVVTSPPGAAVTLDGTVLGTSPFEGNVPAGEHAIGLSLEGHDAAQRSVTLAVGETRTVDVTLVSGVATPIGPTGPGDSLTRLAVEGDPAGAAVLVDGETVGVMPVAGAVVTPGEHLVRVELGDRAWEDRVTTAEGITTRLTVSLGGGVHQGWFWGIASTAVAAAAGAAGTGGYAWSLHDEYETASLARQDEIRPTGELMMDVADALWGVAGAAAIGALVLFFFTDFGEEPSGTVWVPEPTLQGADDDTTALVPPLGL